MPLQSLSTHHDDHMFAMRITVCWDAAGVTIAELRACRKYM